MPSSIRVLAPVLMASMAASALPVAAADIVLTPTAAGGVSITNAAGNATRFRVADDGTVSMPAVAAVPGASTGLCVEVATGRVGTCAIGTITSIVAGTGLAGGTITTTGTIDLAASYRLPQACAANQVPKWSGTAWACAADSDTNSGGTVTSVATGTGLTGGPVTTTGTIGLAASYQLPQSCAANQVPKWSGTAWACAADSDSIPGGTVSGNLTLLNSSASVGNIMKEGSRFIHDYGASNTFIGRFAGNFSLTGDGLTGAGWEALASNTDGYSNTATGSQALKFNTKGWGNTASGDSALHGNTTAGQNTAIGYLALWAQSFSNGNVEYDSQNTAVGYRALTSNQPVSTTTGVQNTAAGVMALQANTTGAYNSAVGVKALTANTTGSENTAVGREALQANTTGASNTAMGLNALWSKTTGSRNSAFGTGAMTGGTTGDNNSALGYQALSQATGNNNIAIGYQAGQSITSGSNNIAIGHAGGAESSTIRIGTGGTHTATYIAGISGATSSGGVAVFVNGSGQLGTVTSSKVFKRDIADMADASSALMRLRPVTFRYRPGVDDGSDVVQYGLVAEEVAAVYPGLVARDAEGKIHTVRYQFLPPMLLNELQKHQRVIEAQSQHIASLERSREIQTAEIAGLKRAVAEVAELKRQMAHMARMIDSLGPEPQVSAALR